MKNCKIVKISESKDIKQNLFHPRCCNFQERKCLVSRDTRGEKTEEHKSKDSVTDSSRLFEIYVSHNGGRR